MTARPGRRARRLGAVLACLGVTTLTQAVVTPPASADDLPGGRATYVIAMMDGPVGAKTVRLATYSFAGDGTVTERYWAWRQDVIVGGGNVRVTKPATGYTTTGCAHACPVRAPVGFQPGTAPRVARGTWSTQDGGVLEIRWSPTYPIERWQLDDGQPGIVGANLLAARGEAYGWGIGSDASPSRGVGLSSVYRSVDWITGPFVENAYAATTRRATSGFKPADYSLCTGGSCLQARRMSGPDKRSWYHSYLAANPARDGRKVYWNTQTGVVQQMEDPRSSCISGPGGGHTNALLEALDDDGRFVGFVGVEASQTKRKYGEDNVAAYLMLVPSMLPAVGR